MAEYIEKDAATRELEKEPVFSDAWNALREARDRIRGLPAAGVIRPVRCVECCHNNDCDIQYVAQAGDNFFCGFGEERGYDP